MSTGVCDDFNNNAYCAWDGGDCCASPKESKDDQFEYCKACACLDCADKDFRTCIVSGKRVKCTGASATTIATTRLSTRARARTTTTTTSTTTPERTRSKSTSSAPAKVTTTSVSRTTTTTTTTVAPQKSDRCVKVAKGACGSKKHKGDGEWSSD